MTKQKFTALTEEVIATHVRLPASCRKKLEALAKDKGLNLTRTLESLINAAHSDLKRQELK